MNDKKIKIFFCTNCGNEYAKWSGQCRSCGEWNSLKEEYFTKSSLKNKTNYRDTDKNKNAQPKLIYDIKSNDTTRVRTPNTELNRVLGGGIISGSIILLGGQPGIGKSTLILQTVLSMDVPVLYISGEESHSQIKMRAERLPKTIDKSQVYLSSATQVDTIISQADKLQPSLIIIDSIQTITVEYVDSTQGSISQIRESASMLQSYAKKHDIPIILIGHITKEGSIAGPKILEHIVDVVLQFEGDSLHSFRTLRSFKNRFGSTDEIGIFEMRADGLKIIENPSEHLVDHQSEFLSGSTIGAMVEGRRSLLIETQALVTKAVYGNPQRVINGYDNKRVSMLLAVLEKRCGFFMNTQDVFLNIAGGIRVQDTALDLAIVAALISSYENVTIGKNTCFAGEIGLGGEVRSTAHTDLRIKEAGRLGIEQIFTSYSAIKGLDTSQLGITVSPLRNIIELKEYVL